jgi:hypothetical protein
VNWDRGGSYVAGSYLHSSGFRYRVQYFRLMAHGMVREEATRKPQHQPRPTPALGTRGKAVNVLLRQAKQKQRNFVPVPYGPGIGASLTHAAILMASMLALVLSLHARFHPLACHLE